MSSFDLQIRSPIWGVRVDLGFENSTLKSCPHIPIRLLYTLKSYLAPFGHNTHGGRWQTTDRQSYGKGPPMLKKLSVKLCMGYRLGQFRRFSVMKRTTQSFVNVCISNFKTRRFWVWQFATVLSITFQIQSAISLHNSSLVLVWMFTQMNMSVFKQRTAWYTCKWSSIVSSENLRALYSRHHGESGLSPHFLSHFKCQAYLLMISARSSIRFPSPMTIGPASAITLAFGWITVRLPAEENKNKSKLMTWSTQNIPKIETWAVISQEICIHMTTWTLMSYI